MLLDTAIAAMALPSAMLCCDSAGFNATNSALAQSVICQTGSLVGYGLAAGAYAAWCAIPQNLSMAARVVSRCCPGFVLLTN